jgi:hypothetical protein
MKKQKKNDYEEVGKYLGLVIFLTSPIIIYLVTFYLFSFLKWGIDLFGVKGISIGFTCLYLLGGYIYLKSIYDKSVKKSS